MKKTYPDGSKYEGEFKRSGLRRQRHGFGTLTFPDGKKYIGQWKDGLEYGH
jgi:hypothetical protein